ncbi:MAG: copper chaperone PCu(A)C [Gemmatimonadota bacterium]|jgi:copper(I)-binding protein|nr:copper chaperone PCu(A)C [Gemmatimonadota bacterium]MDQ8170934.1 copper chaperone PCu(A)C [Gemmatimonadota bacterium]MDQ8174435.1 copper chaperone PCu(A)C [Gemmatimonadota bacterium]MDQ8178795.1 copper chaperone PCu(A)C [Gemmatimonadota bacterium]
MTSRTICAACASGLLLLSGACGGSEQGSSQESADDGAATVSVTTATGLAAVEPWARPADAGKNTAVYLQLENTLPDGDSLIGVRSEGAERAALHESVMEGATMRMRPMIGVALPSGGRIAFRPMGPHVMLLRLRDPLVPGDTVEVTFDFASGRSLAVRAGVRTP